MLSRSILSTAKRSLIPITTRQILPTISTSIIRRTTSIRFYHENVIDHYENQEM